MSSKQKVARDGCDWLLPELWLLQLARLLLAKDIICIATGHIMVNEHLLPLWQVDWLLCPPPNRSAFVLQVNVFAPAVLKSEEELRYTELKAIVMCTGSCFSFYEMACHVHVHKQITVSKCTLFFLANVGFIFHESMYLECWYKITDNIWLPGTGFTS